MMIGGIGFWVTGATFNSLSVISWRSVLLVEKTGVHRGGGGSFPSQIDDKIYQIMMYRVHLVMRGNRTRIVSFERH